MLRTIHAIAAGAVIMLAATRADASDGEAGVVLDDPGPAPLVEPRPVVSDVMPPADDVLPFVWTTDLSLTPPPYVTAATDSHLAPPSATATAIPLPPAAWTGFASLAGLGAIAFLRRLRRLR